MSSTHRAAAADLPAADSVVADQEAADVDHVAAAVTAVPGVAALGGGGLLQPVTYLAGRRVKGVRLSPHCVEVAVVARFGVPAPELAHRIRAAVAPHARGRVVDVLIADLELPAGLGDHAFRGPRERPDGAPRSLSRTTP